MDTTSEKYYVDAAEQYIATALWSELDDDGVPLDRDYGPEDIDREARRAMRQDVRSFIESANDGEWNGTGASLLLGIDPGQCGHDLWLTRNHHGTGFWDRGNGEQGDRLTAIAHPFGESTLYVGDDGRIYTS